MSKIFISYARDASFGQNLAAELQEQLQSEGFKVFRDVIGLKPGDAWYSKLEFELESSDFLLLVVSEKVRRSKWVHNEVSIAEEIGVPVIPVLAERIRLPLWLRHLQVLDFCGDRDFAGLMSILRHGLTEHQTPTPTPTETAHSVSISSKDIFLYQTGGGVDNEALFFGRRELITQIVSRSPANYLLVGGRQMGKSTLLKALKRGYASNPQVQCHYQMLSNEVLIPRLARELRLPLTEDAEIFATELEQRVRETGKRFIFLIDEADLFIEHEQALGYPILNVFRRLSEQSRCSFILAGFWRLYQHAVLDYQSPLRNFGEVLEIGALERDACQQLATQPMKTLNLSYANNKIVLDMVKKCGQRANLIACACQQLIRNLSDQQQNFKAEDIRQALNSREMSKRFDGWVVGISEIEKYYDQLVVYTTISKQNFSTGELIQNLEVQGVHVDIIELERALSRLELSFALSRTKNLWYYCVPLFVEYIKEDDPEEKLGMLLRNEQGTVRTSYNPLKALRSWFKL